MIWDFFFKANFTTLEERNLLVSAEKFLLREIKFFSKIYHATSALLNSV